MELNYCILLDKIHCISDYISLFYFLMNLNYILWNNFILYGKLSLFIYFTYIYLNYMINTEKY